MLTCRQIAAQLRSCDGAEIAEAALVLPLLFMLLLGIVWFGRAFNIYSTIQQAAQQGAITAARNSCATCSNAAPVDASVTTAVAAVMQASNLDPTQITPNSTPLSPVSCVNPATTVACSHHLKVTICRQVLLNATATPTPPYQCGVIVTFQFPFTFYLPFTSLNQQQVMMSAQAQSRMEN